MPQPLQLDYKAKASPGSPYSNILQADRRPKAACRERNAIAAPLARAAKSSDENRDAFVNGSREYTEMLTGPTNQLAFEIDMYNFAGQSLYFHTLADKLKARSRGFMQPIDVYSERMKRPNIETIDINLAWVPGPLYQEGLYPWQPICGPAAYIGGLRSDLKLSYTPDEPMWLEGKEVAPRDDIDIPMLHYARDVLWNQRKFGRTAYVHTRDISSGGEECMSFVPSQAEWSPDCLPPSAAMLEPLTVSKAHVPDLVDSLGNTIQDANGWTRRAFDHVLPANIPRSVQGWLIAAWLAEDPRMT
ncbi:hypothetical protein AAFC00_002981 [Neodothiora populina]